MAIQNINRGTTANDGQGDSARAGALKINQNFAYLLNAEAKFKAILGPEITSETISTDVVEAINTGGSFTLAFANLAFLKYFEIVNGDIKNIYFFKIVNIGGGNKTFGTNGTVTLTENNLFLTGQKLKSVQDFQELNSTVTEDFGDIGTTSLIDYVNGTSPAITIQATSTGATILKAIVDGEGESYLFKGEAGDYGQGELQLVEADLEPLSETSQVSGVDGGNADTLDGLDSTDLVRRTGNISEDITGLKNFIENIITQGDLLANNIIKRNGTINEILLANGATLLKSALEFSNRESLLNFGEDADGLPTYNGVKVDTTIAQRDVLNILTSTNTAVSLSANMGRILKGLIDNAEDTQLTNAEVIASLLTNFTTFGSASDISATDTIFTAFRKLAFRVRLNDDKVTNSIPNLKEVLTEGNFTNLEASLGGVLVNGKIRSIGDGSNVGNFQVTGPTGQSSFMYMDDDNLFRIDNAGSANRDVHFNKNGNGVVISNGFFESSDKRLKTDIKKISKSVYSYELKSQPGITVYGTIAQEIEKTNPEVVKKPEDGGMMSVNYNSFLSLKLAEQENKTDDLQKQIDELRNLIKNK